MVVGAGLAGSAAAWALSRRGRSVVLLEQFGARHDRGSSHGSARIVRRAYGDAFYTDLTGRAFELWREVELASGQTLLRMLGGLDFGPRRNVPAVAAALAASQVRHEVMPAGEAQRRWPGMVFEGDVVFHEQGGTVDAALAVETFVRQACGDTRYNAVVRSVGTDGRVTLADGEVIHANAVVVAAGAWVEALVGAAVDLPPLVVTQQQVFHFPRRDRAQAPWPSVIHYEGSNPVYHLAGGGHGAPDDDRKSGQHDGGVTTTADRRDGVVPAAAQASMIDYVRRWLPGLSDVPTSGTTCLYTETPSEDFVLDRVGALIVCSPCSGHGAKFAPLIGELVADLAAGGAPVERFSLAAHRTGRVGSVSL